MAAAGLGRLLVTGSPPVLAARDAGFRLEQAPLDAPATVVLDLGDGAAWHAARGLRLWGAACGLQVLLGAEPARRPGRRPPPPQGAARAILETLAAGEVLRMVLGDDPHAYNFTSPGASPA